MSDAVEGQSQGGASKGKLFKLLALALVAIVVLGGAGAGGFFYFQKVKAKTNAEGKEKEESKEKDKGKEKHKEKDKDFVTVKDQDADEEESSEEETAHERPKSGKADGEKEGKAESEGKSEKSSSKPKKYALPNDSEVSHVLDLQPIISNLADTEGTRYLRLGVSIGMKGEEGGKEHKPEPLLLARIRNAILTVLMNKTSEEVSSASGKILLRQELLKVVRAATPDKEIEAVYITEFLIQR